MGTVHNLAARRDEKELREWVKSFEHENMTVHLWGNPAMLTFTNSLNTMFDIQTTVPVRMVVESKIGWRRSSAQIIRNLRTLHLEKRKVTAKEILNMWKNTSDIFEE